MFSMAQDVRVEGVVWKKINIAKSFMTVFGFKTRLAKVIYHEGV